MKDTFALKNPGKISYTYIHTLGNSLIDRIFVSKNIKAKDIMTCRHVVFPASDHLAVKLVIDLGKVNCKTIRAPFWKLNASVLEEELFCQEFQELWERLQYKKRHFGTVSVWWERVFKSEFQKLAKRYCTEKKKDEKEYRDFLTGCMREAKERIDAGENLTKEYVDLRHEYKELINRLEKGRKLRGRIEAQDTNELSSIANLVKERTKEESKLVKKIKSGGSVTTNQDEIAKHFKDFLKTMEKGTFRQEQKRELHRANRKQSRPS